MGQQRGEELPSSFAVGRETEASIIRNKANSIENKHTWKLYLGFGCKPNHSLSVKP